MDDAEREIARLLARNPELRIKGDYAKDVGATAPIPSEHDSQVLVVAWVDAHENVYPDLAMFTAHPLGGYRPMIAAKSIRAEGARAGLPDMAIYSPRRNRHTGQTYHGLFIELKIGDRSNKPTAEQRAWLDRLTAQGYLAVVCFGHQEAIETIKHYLDMER